MILFVASDTQHYDRTVFNGWIEYLVPNGNYLIVDSLYIDDYIHNPAVNKIVAMGGLAGLLLSQKQVSFYKIYSPSVNLEKPVNYMVQVEAVLEDCKKYLEV